MIFDCEQRGAARITLGVLEKVGKDAFEAPLVNQDVPGGNPGGELDRHVGSGRPNRVFDEGSNGHLVAGEVAVAGVEPRDLQRARRRAAGTCGPPPRAGRAPGAPWGQLLAPRLEDRERVGECREGRAELMVDVRAEARFSFYALLELVHHVVEGGGEGGEVGEVGALEPGVEVPSRDREGGPGGLVQRPQRSRVPPSVRGSRRRRL